MASETVSESPRNANTLPTTDRQAAIHGRTSEAHKYLLASLLEIQNLAGATDRLFGNGDEDGGVIHGLMARITVLTEIVFYSQKIIQGDDAEPVDIKKLQEAFEGRLYA